jgi:hypothetical protein
MVAVRDGCVGMLLRSAGPAAPQRPSSGRPAGSSSGAGGRPQPRNHAGSQRRKRNLNRRTGRAPVASFDRLHKRFAAAAAWPFSGTPFVQPIKTLSAPSSGGILRFIALMWPLAPAACANVYSYSCCTLYAVRVPYIHARAGRLCPTTAVASYRAPYFEYRTSTSTS